MSISISHRSASHSLNKSASMPPNAVPSSNDPTQHVHRLQGLGKGFTIKGIGSDNGVVASRLSIEIGAGNDISVGINRGQTPLQSAKLLKAALEQHTRGGLSAKITRLEGGGVKFVAIRRDIKPNE